MFAAIGMMATPTMLFIGFGLFAEFEDLPDLMISTFVVVSAFGTQGALVSWRGRNMFDPPGKAQVPQRPEPPSKERESDSLEIVDSSGDSSSDSSGD